MIYKYSDLKFDKSDQLQETITNSDGTSCLVIVETKIAELFFDNGYGIYVVRYFMPTKPEALHNVFLIKKPYTSKILQYWLTETAVSNIMSTLQTIDKCTCLNAQHDY